MSRITSVIIPPLANALFSLATYCLSLFVCWCCYPGMTFEAPDSNSTRNQQGPKCTLHTLDIMSVKSQLYIISSKGLPPYSFYRNLFYRGSYIQCNAIPVFANKDPGGESCLSKKTENNVGHFEAAILIPSEMLAHVDRVAPQTQSGLFIILCASACTWSGSYHDRLRGPARKILNSGIPTFSGQNDAVRIQAGRLPNKRPWYSRVQYIIGQTEDLFYGPQGRSLAELLSSISQGISLGGPYSDREGAGPACECFCAVRLAQNPRASTISAFNVQKPRTKASSGGGLLAPGHFWQAGRLSQNCCVKEYFVSYLAPSCSIPVHRSHVVELSLVCSIFGL